MKKEELWKIYTDKNPSFLMPGLPITLSSDGIKKLFEQTWDQAFKAGQEAATPKITTPLEHFKKVMDDLSKGGA